MSDELVKHNLETGLTDYLRALSVPDAEDEDAEKLLGRIVRKLTLSATGQPTLKLKKEPIVSQDAFRIVILSIYKSRALWPPKVAGEEEQKRPQCSTHILPIADFDSEATQGNWNGEVKSNFRRPSGKCATCAYNRYGSEATFGSRKDGKGKVCKEQTLLFAMLVDTEKTKFMRVPGAPDPVQFVEFDGAEFILIQLSQAANASSLNQMMQKLKVKRAPISSVAWKFSQVIEGEGEVQYAKAVFDFYGLVAPESAAMRSVIREDIKKFVESENARGAYDLVEEEWSLEQPEEQTSGGVPYDEIPA